jgi:hypothetical protein
MASKKAHLDLASRNWTTIVYLRDSGEDHSDWVATIAFYKALHLIEAVFADDKAILHSSDHSSRESFLKKTPRYQPLWKHYRPLFAASLIARYLDDGSGKEVTCFNKYMDAEKVKKELLDHRLHQIKKMTATMLKK